MAEIENSGRKRKHPEESFISNTISKTSPTSKRLATQDFEQTVGLSTSHFPQLRLPQNRHILQRWKGLQIDSNFNKQITGRDHARKMWPEVKAVWQKSRLPMLDVGDKKCIDKIVKVIASYQDLKRTPQKRKSTEYQEFLNSLFDVSVGEDNIEAALRATRDENWKEYILFYQGQKSHPQLYTLGGVDLKEATKERRSTERKEKEEKRATREKERIATVERLVKSLKSSNFTEQSYKVLHLDLPIG